MERRSFLKAAKADGHSPSPSASTRNFFHGVDLNAQPFLTKRGRKTNRVVQRVFVILDGYLFYFQSALAAEPCGVIPLENSEYVTHSYASSERLLNLCFELRSPARDWGSVVLHFHDIEHSRVHEVERVLTAAGARSRQRGSVASIPPPTTDTDRKPRQRPVLSRLITLSRRLLAPRQQADSAGEDAAAGNGQDGSVPVVSVARVHNTDVDQLSDDETTTFICKSASKGQRSSLVKLKCRRRSLDLSSDAGAEVHLSEQQFGATKRKRNTIVFAGGNDGKLSIPLDHGDFVAEQNISVELCHDLCTNGFVENSGRKLFHFIAPFWPWECQRQQADRFLLTMEGDKLPRVRFATTDESHRATRISPSATAYRGMIEIWAIEGRVFASIQVSKERALSFPLVLSNAHGSITLGSPSKHKRPMLCLKDDSSVSYDKQTVALPQRVTHGSVYLSSAQEAPKTTALAIASPPTFDPTSLAMEMAELSTLSTSPSKCFPPLSSSSQYAKSTPVTSAPSSAPVRQRLLALPCTQEVCLPLEASSPTASAPPVKSISSPLAKAKLALSPPKSSAKANMLQPPVLTTETAASSTSSAPSLPKPAAATPRDIHLVQAVSLAESYSGSCHLKKYEPIKTIGCGGFGHVMVARHKSTGQLVAIKSLSKKAITAQNQIQHSMSEKAVLTMCRNHPFIIQIHAAFQTIDHLHMVLDYCPGGELFFHLSQAGRFKEHQTVFYAAEVFLALEHLHNHDIIYRDLKPENVLLDKHGHVQLADFGLSKCGVDDWSVAMTFCGSIEYLAPEVLALGEPAMANALTATNAQIRTGYGKAADFWALGCLLYELLTGEPPFYSGNNRPMLYSRIMKGSITFPTYISTEAKQLIQGLLTVDPSERLGARRRGHAAIREHPFFTKYIDWNRLRHRNMRPPFQPRSEDFANFDKQFTSMPVGAVDKMTQFPRNLPMDYQLFENYNWEPTSKI